MTDFYANVTQWAHDRNLIEGSTIEKQELKLWEEYGELCAGEARGDKERVKDAIGDVMVVMTIIGEMLEGGEWYTLKTVAYCGHDDLRISMYYNNLIDSRNALAQIAINNGLTLEECMDYAWNNIKDRKGVMRDGVFIKQEDLA